MILIEPVTQPELYEPVHEGLHPARLRADAPETVYAEHWIKLNKRDPCRNGGHTYLEHILCPTGRDPGPVTQRDATVAACVVQWLGTNCGMAFIIEAEREIARRGEEKRARAMDRVYRLIWRSYSPRAAHRGIALEGL